MGFIVFSTVLLVALSSVLALSEHSINGSGKTFTSDFNGPSKKFIYQQVDNFNKTDKRVFKNYYWQYMNHFEKNGPILVCISYAEYFVMSQILPFYQEFARKSKSAVFKLEHRYTRYSYPAEEYDYLSIRQALADVANFIKTIKNQEQFKSSKVVVIGDSEIFTEDFGYSSNIAVLMRALYPDLVDAAIASSAPLLAKPEVDYYNKITHNFNKYGSPKCVAKIRAKFDYYKYMFSFNKGIDRLKKMYNICEKSDMTIKINQEWLVSAIISYDILRFAHSPANIKRFCDRFELSHNYVNKLNGLMYDKANDQSCNYYDLKTVVETYKRRKDPWISKLYQRCTELGLFTPTSNDTMFGDAISPELYYNLCQMCFGPEFNETRVQMGVKATNDLFDRAKRNVSKVVFFNGGMDPWIEVKLKQNISDDAPLFFVQDVQMCADVGIYSKHDSAELKQVRKMEQDLILKWIQQ